MKRIKINNNYEDIRLDKALSIILESTSRSKIQEYIDQGFILVNDKSEKASYKLRKDDEIFIADFPNETYDLEAEKIDLDIVPVLFLVVSCIKIQLFSFGCDHL